MSTMNIPRPESQHVHF